MPELAVLVSGRSSDQSATAKVAPKPDLIVSSCRRTETTAGFNSRPKEWSRTPEPHRPNAGCCCSRNNRRPYVSLIWCSTRSGHGNGLRPLDPTYGRRIAHEPRNLTLDLRTCPWSSRSRGRRRAAGVPATQVVQKNKSIVRLLLAASYPAAAAVVRTGGRYAVELDPEKECCPSTRGSSA